MIAATAVWLLVPAMASADTRYASPTGSGPPGLGGCPENNPCSLDAAVEDASVQAADEVIVKPGTYTNLTDDTFQVSDPINLHGEAGSPRPVITESGSNPVLFLFGGGGVNAVIHDLELTNTGTTGQAINLGGATASGAIVSNVVATNQAAAAFACELHNAFLADSLCRNTGTGAAAGISAGGQTSGVTLRNDTLYSGAGIAIDVTGNGASTSLAWDAKNVIAFGGGATDVKATSTLGATVSVTLAYSNYDTRSEVTGGTVTDPTTNNNQTVAPQFVDAANGDFHEVSTSPTRNAGISDQLGATDLDGDPRTLESIPDIGVDEFAPDGDGDGVKDYTDNCPGNANPGQEDADNDSLGDVCDPTPNGPQPPDGGGGGADTTAPDTQITAGPKTKTKSKSATFSFSSAESDSTFECQLDDGPFQTCSSPDTLKVKKGKHTFAVRAKDAAGNVDPTPATDGWKVKKKKKR